MFVNENVFPILTFLKQTFQGLLQKLKFSFIILTFFFMVATLYSLILILHPYLKARCPVGSLGLLGIYEPHLLGPVFPYLLNQDGA